MSSKLTIGMREVSANHPPYIIAEIGANHGNRVQNVLEAIDAAYACGCDAVKIQVYTPECMTLKSDRPEFMIQRGPWAGRTYFDLYSEGSMPVEWLPALFARANQRKIQIFSSVFDVNTIPILESLRCPAYKIASPEIIDLELIRAVSKTGKPVILSTGMATNLEVIEAVGVASRNGAGGICILHCNSGYPTPAEDVNLGRITKLISTFKYNVGYSDHTQGIVAAPCAVVKGAVMIEKHFMPHENLNTLDGEFSIGIDDMRKLVTSCDQAWEMNKEICSTTPSEKPSLVYRRSIFVTKPIKKGEHFTKENVSVIRPHFGLAPKYITYVLNGKSLCDLEAGEPLQLEHIAD